MKKAFIRLGTVGDELVPKNEVINVPFRVEHFISRGDDTRHSPEEPHHTFWRNQRWQFEGVCSCQKRIERSMRFDFEEFMVPTCGVDTVEREFHCFGSDVTPHRLRSSREVFEHTMSI